MINVKLINYKHIGEVKYTKNTRARNLSIRINSQGSIRVTVPYWCTYKNAENFVLQKEQWISNKLLNIKQKQDQIFHWNPGDIIALQQKNIQIVQGTTNEYEVDHCNTHWEVSVPYNFNPEEQEQRDFLYNLIGRVGYREARVVLPFILEEHAERLSLRYEKVTVRRMKSRWGSCSGANNISLNSALIFLDRDLVDYVCIHELMHIIHKNHSKNFWNAVQNVLPDYKEKRKRLKAQSIIA